MKYFNLFDGTQIPTIGLGTWQQQQPDLETAIQFAIKAGYQLIDGAAFYGNEDAIGETLVKCLKQRLISREQLWLTSKLWCSYHRPEDVLPAFKASLHALQMDYLDLYLMHWPIAFAPHVGLGTPDVNVAEDFLTLEEVPLIDTWQAMEELVKAGLVRYIGVSNFSVKKLE